MSAPCARERASQSICSRTERAISSDGREVGGPAPRARAASSRARRRATRPASVCAITSISSARSRLLRRPGRRSGGRSGRQHLAVLGLQQPVLERVLRAQPRRLERLECALGVLRRTRKSTSCSVLGPPRAQTASPPVSACGTLGVAQRGRGLHRLEQVGEVVRRRLGHGAAGYPRIPLLMPATVGPRGSASPRPATCTRASRTASA